MAVSTPAIDTAAFKPHQLANAGAVSQPHVCVSAATLIIDMPLSVGDVHVCL